MSEHESEARSIFQLLNPSISAELHVDQINTLVQKIDDLDSFQETTPSLNETEPIQPTSQKELDADSLSSMSGSKTVFRVKTFKKVNSDVRLSGKTEKLKKIALNPKMSSDTDIGRIVAPPTRKKKDTYDLKAFPNKKKTMELGEFVGPIQGVIGRADNTG